MATFAQAIRDGVGHQTRAAYAGQVASYLARTGEWSRVDELLAPLSAAAVEEAPSGRGDPVHAHCAPAQAGSATAALEQVAALDARVRAAAALKDRAKVERLLGELDRARKDLQPYMEKMQPKDVLARLDQAHVHHRRVLIARASGDDRALLAALQASAKDNEEQTAVEVNPNGYLVDEAIGDALLRLGRAREASAAYASALQHHPGRAHALLGGARAAAKASDAAAAKALYAKLLQVWSSADDGTDGLAEARAAVTK
jgi:predicted Zn-dependent protease